MTIQLYIDAPMKANIWACPFLVSVGVYSSRKNLSGVVCYVNQWVFLMEGSIGRNVPLGGILSHFAMGVNVQGGIG